MKATKTRVLALLRVLLQGPLKGFFDFACIDLEVYTAYRLTRMESPPNLERGGESSEAGRRTPCFCAHHPLQ